MCSGRSSLAHRVGARCREAVARRGKARGEQLRTSSNQVGSCFPERQKFRLTAEVKAKFTEKLRQDQEKPSAAVKHWIFE
jgi:hypothetical protein